MIRAVAYNPIPHWGRVITSVCPGQEGIEGGCGLARHILASEYADVITQ